MLKLQYPTAEFGCICHLHPEGEIEQAANRCITSAALVWCGYRVPSDSLPAAVDMGDLSPAVIQGWKKPIKQPT